MKMCVRFYPLRQQHANLASTGLDLRPNYYSAAVRRLFPQSNLAVLAGYGSIFMKVSHGIEGRPSGAPGMTGKPLRLLDQVRARMRRFGLARRTEGADGELGPLFDNTVTME